MYTQCYVTASSQTKQTDLAVSLPINLPSTTTHTHRQHFLLLLRPKSDTRFTIQQREVESTQAGVCDAIVMEEPLWELITAVSWMCKWR